jgi:hypothetical protein
MELATPWKPRGNFIHGSAGPAYKAMCCISHGKPGWSGAPVGSRNIADEPRKRISYPVPGIESAPFLVRGSLRILKHRSRQEMSAGGWRDAVAQPLPIIIAAAGSFDFQTGTPRASARGENMRIRRDAKNFTSPAG